MVAQVDSPASGTRTRKPRAPTVQIPLVTRTQVRNLYLTHCLPHKEIADRTGLKLDAVKNLIFRERWANLKVKLNKKAQESAVACAEASLTEIVQAVAMETEELTLGTLAKAKVTLERTDRDAARDLQAYSQAAKNFNGIMREARNLNASANQGEGATVNVMFVGALPRSSQRSVTNVTPAAPQSEASVVPASGQTIDVSVTPGATTPPP
jgi:hypothetical protein